MTDEDVPTLRLLIVSTLMLILLFYSLVEIVKLRQRLDRLGVSLW